VTHAYNPSYSGDRDQEDQGLKPVGANNCETLSRKSPTHKKRAGGVAQGVSLEFKPQNHTHTKGGLGTNSGEPCIIYVLFPLKATEITRSWPWFREETASVTFMSHRTAQILV
jgi:hypothetical protein